MKWKEWGKVVGTLAAFAVIGVGMTLMLQALPNRLHIPLYDVAWLAYLTVFLGFLVSNMSLVAPVPIALSVMMAAAATWNPALIALAAAAGASIGEMSGYLAGYLGRKVILPETFMCRINQMLCAERITYWTQRYGMWAVAGLAAQPILPFDIAGVVAGAARMPVRKFLPALLAGRIPKYLVLSYLAAGMLSHVSLPFFK